MAIGAQPGGRFDAIIHTGVCGMSRHHNMAESFISSSGSLYAAGSFKLEVQAAYLNMMANTFMGAHGVGEIGITGVCAAGGQRHLQRHRQARP